MSTTAVAAIKAAILALTDESTRKKIGWVLVAILSPIIVIIALICSIFSATSQQNVSTVELCFHGGIISSEVTPEYRQYVLEMRESFSTLDSMVDEINAQLEDDNSLTQIGSRPFFMFCISAPSSRTRWDCNLLWTAL